MNASTRFVTELENRRKLLGMKKTTLAERAGVSLPTVNRTLSGSERSPTLPTIVAIAAALGLKLELEAAQEPDDFRHAQAKAKATRIAQMVQGTMALEAQAVDPKTIERLVEQTVHELLAGSARRLWAS